MERALDYTYFVCYKIRYVTFNDFVLSVYNMYLEFIFLLFCGVAEYIFKRSLYSLEL